MAQNNVVNVLVESGTYSPTATAVLNLDSVSASTMQYMRVGNVVTVSGEVNVDSTTSGSLSQFRLSLPIASTFANDHECAGSGCEKNTSTQSGCTIFADTSNNECSVLYRAGLATATSVYITFTYLII